MRLEYDDVVVLGISLSACTPYSHAVKMLCDELCEHVAEPISVSTAMVTLAKLRLGKSGSQKVVGRKCGKVCDSQRRRWQSKSRDVQRIAPRIQLPANSVFAIAKV